jgi:hypothetical protein
MTTSANHFMIDVSNPTAAGITQMPDGFEAVAGYIGGDTPHVWTRSEWGGFNGWRKLPIYVASNQPNTNNAGISSALGILDALWNCGPRLPLQLEQAGTPVALDLETVVIPDFVTGFAAVMNWAGFQVWPYGSASTLQGNPECQGYWAADWTNEEHILPWSIATQYMTGTFDRSQVSDAGYSALKIW